MPKFSQRSQANLATCDQKLQDLFNEVIKHVDCTILEGHRNREEQEEAFRTGKSQLHYPHGNHNAYPSNAVDAVPYPIDWENTDRLYMFSGFVQGIAAKMGISIRVGADWDGDFNTKNQHFVDLPHFELKK